MRVGVRDICPRLSLKVWDIRPRLSLKVWDIRPRLCLKERRPHSRSTQSWNSVLDVASDVLRGYRFVHMDNRGAGSPTLS